MEGLDPSAMQEKEAKGREGGSSGCGGSNRGVRGVDFGLGIGYSAEPKTTPSNSVPSRSAAVSSLKSGMISQFKKSFVTATPNSQNQGASSYANKGMTIPGFVSGGSIGGDPYISRSTNSFAPPPTSTGNNAGQSTSQNANQKNSKSSRERPRERRRPSGWDR